MNPAPGTSSASRSRDTSSSDKEISESECSAIVMSENGDRLGGDGSKEDDGNKKTSPDNSVVRNVRQTMESMPEAGAATATATEDGRGEQQGAKPTGRRFLTRASAADRLKAQAALTTSIRAMEIDANPENYSVHKVMTGQLLDILEREHNEYVVNEELDINLEPQKSYMKEYRDKLQRATTKHKALLGILPANKEKTQPQPRTDFLPGEDDLLSSVSRWSSASKLSTGPTLLHKLKHMQSRIKAKAEAVEKVVNHKNIGLKPKVLSKAGVTWNQLEVLRCEYEGVLDEAFEKCGEDCEELNAIVKGNDDQWVWLTEVESKLEEMLMMKESPEKAPDKTKEFLDLTAKEATDPSNLAFSAAPHLAPPGTQATSLAAYLQLLSQAQTTAFTVPPPIGQPSAGHTPGRPDQVQHYLDLTQQLQSQAAANRELEQKFLEQEIREQDTRDQLANLRVQKTGQTDPKAAMRLPTCPPPKFTGINLDYIPWKRLWGETMGQGYKEAVQLMQLKSSVPTRTANLIGLSEIRTMKDFWGLMDGEYLDYNVLAKSAVADVKSLDRKDPRFLQMMRVKLQTHSTNLEEDKMGHRITSDEMVREHWIPLLTDMAREDWLKMPNREPPLWNHFEKFLEIQSLACRERERMSVSTPAYGSGASTDSTTCTKCKSKLHTTQDCKGKFCTTCRSWKCNCKRFQNRQRPDTNQEPSYCKGCEDYHPYGAHTRSIADARRKELNNPPHRTYMQAASTCGRCKREVATQTTCGACGQIGKTGEKLHCFDHCLDFINASPDERLRQVQKFGDCCICLLRDHNTEAHIAGAANKPDKMKVCGLYDKQTNATCTSTQNASFHGSSTHKQYSHKGFHARSFPQQAGNIRDSGLSTTRGEWVKAAKELTRDEEMMAATKLLHSPDLDGDRILLMIQEITVVTGRDRKKQSTSIFFDKGSTCTMVSRRLVDELKMDSERKTLIVESFGHTDSLNSEYVVLEILQADGTVAQVRAYVVDSITRMAAVSISEQIRQEFSPSTTWPESRFSGEIDILLGMEELSLHPILIERKGNLGIFLSPLSTVTVMGGRHEKIQPDVSTLSQTCRMLRGAKSPTKQQQFRLKQMDDMFMLGDTMGEYIPKSCSNCRKCTTCTYAGKAISQKERIELEYIERGITHNKEKKQFDVKYPFLEDPRDALTDNRRQAIAYATSLEKKLDKHQLTKKFDEEFEKFLQTKSLRKIPDEELKTWDGPVHYVPLQLVVNEGSQSTPFRIVTNTSCKDPRTGKSLNDILAKGPNLLSDSYQILLRFRNRKYAISTDVTKAYHGLRTGKAEMHLRRVVYRKSKDKEWETYGFLCVSFGDVCAQCILECCLKQIGEAYKHWDIVAATMILLDRFVDDQPSGSDSKKIIDRLRGKILEDWQTTGTLAAMYAMGGFVLKVIACSGDKDGPMVQKLGGSVLGIKWCTETDKFSIPLTVNISYRRKGSPTGPDLTESDKEMLEQAVLTRRICLSVTMSLYDPLGFIVPLTIRLKWLLQELAKTSTTGDWDEQLSTAQKEPWTEIFKMMLEQKDITLDRSCKPENVNLLEEVILIAFMDGSNAAKAFVAYIRYMLHCGEAHVALLAAKAKLNSAGGQSTPRSEMDGHTLGARGVKNITTALKDVTPKITKVYMLGDSRTILQALQSGATPFSEFFANRIGEIYDMIREIPGKVEVIWGWVQSSDNGADIASRTTSTPNELVEGSEWQTGPAFLKKPVSEWPMRTDIMTGTVELPTEELRKQYRHMTFEKSSKTNMQTFSKPKSTLGEQEVHGSHRTFRQSTVAEDHELDKIASSTNSWTVALSKTRMLTRWLELSRGRSLTMAYEQGMISKLYLENCLANLANNMALRLWLQHAGKETIIMMNKGKLRNMVIEIKNGIPMVQTRFKVKTQHYFGATELPLILASTHLGYLICQDAHDRTHRAGDLALSVTKQTAFIVGGKKILMSIRKRCMICRKEQAEPIKQRMGDFPESLQHQDGAFRKIGLDLAGPFKIRADMRRRSTRQDEGRVKVWVVVIVCSCTSAVKLYLSRDYSEEGFLQAWTQHTSDCGEPDLVYSDRGSQLISAAGGLDPGDQEDELDWTEVSRKTGVKWIFTPAQSQWRNGKAEAVVKCSKMSLRTTFRQVNMDYFDFYTTLKQISFMLNSRPVELLLGTYSKGGGGQELDSDMPDTWTAITPNDLLISDGHAGSMRTNYSPETGPKRLAHIQQKIEQWHMAWLEACQDKLFQRDGRWVKKTRNMREGDVVWMIQDSKLQRKLKWGIVKTIHPDHDGVVRDVMIRYILIKPGPEPYITPYSKKSPFKTKLCAVQTLAMMYSVEDQQTDRRDRMLDQMSASCEIDLMGKEAKEQKTFAIDVKEAENIEIGKLLTWMPDDLEEEDVTRSVSEETLEVPVAVNAQTKDTADFTIQRMSSELPNDWSEEVDGTNDEPDDDTNKVHVNSLTNRIVGTNSRTYLEEAETTWTSVSPEADVEAAGSPETMHKEIQKIKEITPLIEEEVRALPGSHFLGYHSVKTTSSKLYRWRELGMGSAASTTVRNDSGHVQEIKPNTTLLIPDVSERPGVEMCEDRRQGCLPQLRRQGDAKAVTGTRTSSPHAAGLMFSHEETGAISSPCGTELV